MTFYPQSVSTWGDEEVAAAKRVIDFGFTTMGPEVRAFEEEFAAYHGMLYACMVNSGSSANLIATAALFFKKDNPLKRGDEVIVPALSWATTFHPLQQYGFKLRFVDVDLDTLNIDVALLEAALTPDTRAIVAVSILGNPADLVAIKNFANKHDLYMIEDNCESLDAHAPISYDDRDTQQTGTFGDLNTFSFFFSHHISTMEGGMILTDNEELAQLCKSLRAHGWTRDIPPGVIYEERPNDPYEAYRFILPGYNVRPLEMSGAIGREQLKKLPDLTHARRQNMYLFRDQFGVDGRFIIQKENGYSSAFTFTLIPNVRAHPEFLKDNPRPRIFAALKQAEIGHRIVTGGNFLRHEAIKYFDYSVAGDGTPNADIVHDYGFFVGNSHLDLSEQILKLREIIDKVV
jgi:CDP-6-deoxy-D-xylo-4-hexulose-3-dehydrase